MPISEVHNCDCMDFMRDLPDNFFDLAIADPPFGISYARGKNGWGCELDKEYFDKANERFEKECHGVTRLPDGTTIRQLSIFD